jgi:polar amino acid transport system substrate-binding protein
MVLVVNAQGVDIRVVTEEWPPYNYSVDEKIVGVVTEVVSATLYRSGLDYSIERLPSARAYDMAKAEENVLIYSIFKLPNRAGKFKWIKLDGLSVDMFLCRPKYRNDVNLNSLDDAKNYRVGVLRESASHHFLLSKGFVDGVNLFPVNSEWQNMLKSKPDIDRIDLVTGNKLFLAYWLKILNLPSDYWVEQVPLFQKDIYMAFGRNTSDVIVDRVHDAFNEIKAEGTLDAIVEKSYKMFE